MDKDRVRDIRDKGFHLFSATIFILYSQIATAVNSIDEAPVEMVQLASQTVICKMLPTLTSDQANAAINNIVSSNGIALRHQYYTVFSGFSAPMSQQAMNTLQANNPNIEYCASNALMGGGGSFVSDGGKGGNGGKPGQVNPQIVPEGVIRVGGPLDGTGLVAWIIDSGIDLNHPDLNVDVARGYDAVAAIAKGIETFDDVNGHGTHVAGILAAIDNDRDVVGVAAGATVVPVRVLSANNFGYADDVIAGMDYVAANASAFDVANMSIWGWSHNHAMHDAALALADRISVITISGNGSEDINQYPTEPGHVEHDHLFTVSAVDHNDLFTDFSNWGSALDWSDCSASFPAYPFPCATVDFAAPGKNVISLKPGGGLAEWYGTSMASPHVAAIILKLQNRSFRPSSNGFAINDPDSSVDPIIHY